MAQRSYKRRQYLINKSFQLRYMVMIVFTLLIISATSIISIYFGVWGSVLDEFSDESVRYQLLTAARMTDYEYARRPFSDRRFSTLALFKETELLSQRQQEVFRDILDRTNQKLVWQVAALLVFISAWSIFITHRIAGPMFRFEKCFKQLADGDLTVRGHLRKGDEARELMESFNEMVEGLEKPIKKLKQISGQVQPTQIKEQVETELNHFRTS